MEYERKDDKLIEILKANIEQHQNNDFAQHEEIRRLNVIQGKSIDQQNRSIESLTRAMFGDPNDKSDKGTKQKVDEIYEVLIGGSLAKKILAWAFGVIMSLIAAAYLIFNFIKALKEK